MKILVCDDDPVIRYLLEMVLERRGGHRVRAVDHPDAVAPAAVEWNPDLLVVDYVMPERSGIELVEDLRREEATRWLPVVLLTGRSDVAESEKLERLDVAGIVEKPFDTSTLSDRLTELATVSR